MSARVRLAVFLFCIIFSVSGCSWFKSNKADGEGNGLSEADLNAQREGRFGSGGIPIAEGEGMFRDIHFDYDSTSISDTARQDLEYNAQVLQGKSEWRIQLEGHCDERGTAEYNLALGSERARGVKEALIALGVSSSKLDTISYGEEVPLDPGHSESSWAKNRRVHFSAFAGSGSAGSGSTTGGSPAPNY